MCKVGAMQDFKNYIESMTTEDRAEMALGLIAVVRTRTGSLCTINFEMFDRRIHEIVFCKDDIEDSESLPEGFKELIFYSNFVDDVKNDLSLKVLKSLNFFS